jgi:hypothetical protein
MDFWEKNLTANDPDAAPAEEEEEEETECEEEDEEGECLDKTELVSFYDIEDIL